MEQSDTNLQTSKKRAADAQVTKDNPGLEDDDEGVSENEGTFERASEEILATRTVKLRKMSPTSSPASNSFSAISMVLPVSEETGKNISITEKEADGTKDECIADTDNNGAQDTFELADGKVEESKNSETNNVNNTKTDAEDEMNNEVKGNAKESETADIDTIDNDKEDIEDKTIEGKDSGENTNTEKNAESTSFGPFQHLSTTQNAFSGLAQSGLSTTSSTFGSIPQHRPQPLSTSTVQMEEIFVINGEEHEEVFFTSDSVLYEFIDGSWKRRGKGELRVNFSETGSALSRIIMRAIGNQRLIMNARLFPEMRITEMDKSSVMFACVNMLVDGPQPNLSTFALKFRNSATAEEFQDAVESLKDRTGDSRLDY